MQSNRFASLALAAGVVIAATWCDVAIAAEPNLPQPIRVLGFTGSGGAGDGRLKHFPCVHAEADDPKVCVVTVQVATHPFDADKGECLIRVKDVIVFAKNTDQIKWKLVMDTKKEFYFADKGVDIDSNRDKDDGESGGRGLHCPAGDRGSG